MLHDGEWKWTAELVIAFGLPALALAGIGFCLWRESQLNQAFDIWDTRLAEVDGDVSVLLQADRERMVAEHSEMPLATAADCDEIWERPAYGEAS